MAASSEPRIVSYTAEIDLSDYQYRFVKLGTTKKLVDISGANGRAIGILQNAPDIGEASEVALTGGGAKLKMN